MRERTVKYETSMDDLIALTFDQMRWSKRTRRQVLVGILVGPIAAVLILLLHTLDDEPLSDLMVVIMVAFGVMLPLMLLYTYCGGGRRAAVRKAYAEGKNLALIGVHELTLHDEYFEIRAPMFASQMRWDMVEQIRQTDGHIFFYVSALSAHIVPKSAFDDAEEASAFAAEAISLWEQSRSRQPELEDSPPWARSHG